MKKILSLLMLFCFLISCEEKESNFSEEMIDKLADRGEIKDGIIRLPPPPSTFSDIYINANNNEYILTTGDELLFFYKECYSNKFKSFKEFLDVVLNKNFVFNKRLFKDSRYPKSFKLNSRTEKEYKDLGFDKFLQKYSKPSSRKDVLELNKSIIKSGEYLTVCYFLYKNRYDISRDCYIGKDYIRKRRDF